MFETVVRMSWRSQLKRSVLLAYMYDYLRLEYRINSTLRLRNEGRD